MAGMMCRYQQLHPNKNIWWESGIISWWCSYMYTHMHTSVQTQVHTRTHKQTLTRTLTHTCSQAHTCTPHTHVFVCVCVCVCTCVYIVILYMLPNSIKAYTKFLQDIWMTSISVCAEIFGNAGEVRHRYVYGRYVCHVELKITPTDAIWLFVYT